MKNRRKSASRDSQHSLFGEILDWMLAPLLFVWPISIAVTHYFANSVAGYPYDQSLRENVNAISRQIELLPSRSLRLNFPAAARDVLHADETDAVYFRVIGTRGEHLAGDWDLPLPPVDSPSTTQAGVIGYFDSELNGEALRVAYQYLSFDSLPKERWVLVEVGETLEKRSQLANKIIASVILPQFIIIPLAVLLVWFGLSRGLLPLTRLQDRIEARRPGDLSPIDTERVPEELMPLIDAFNALLERLKRNMEAQHRFIADAAHQMRTPLTGLKTQTQLALREADPAQLRQALIHIGTSVDRAAHLVNQLLSLARAEAEEVVTQAMVPLDLDALLRERVVDWVPQALAKHIDLGYEACERGGLVRGNAFWLGEVANNLVDNAIRYTPEGGKVTCRVRNEGGLVVLEVEDTGIGINEADAHLLFERFYRADNATTEGSGLGLAIVKEVAELHQGSASLVANPAGQGAVARITLPALGSTGA